MKKILFVLVCQILNVSSHAIFEVWPHDIGSCITKYNENGDFESLCMDEAYYSYEGGALERAINIWLEHAQSSATSKVQAEAMYNLGAHIFRTDESQRKLAFELIRDAANISPSIYTNSAMGYMFQNGFGVTKNEKLALTWYERAASKGDLDSQIRVAEIYFNGIGIKEDKQQAFNWYLEAAKQGHLDSQIIIAEMYFNGIGVKEDKQQAFNWYLKAGDDGYFKTKYMIGRMYQDGIGTKKNANQAFIWLQKAINQGERLEQSMDSMTILNDAKSRITQLLAESKTKDTIKQSNERNNCDDYDENCLQKIVKKQYEAMQTCNGPSAEITEEAGRWLLATCIRTEPKNVNACYQFRLNNWKDFILSVRNMQQINHYCK